LLDSPPPPTLLKTISTGFTVLFAYKYIKYIDHIHPPLPSSFTLPDSHYYSLQTGLALHSCLLFFLKGYICCSKEFLCALSHMNILYFNQRLTLITLSHPFSLFFNSFPCVWIYHLHIQMQCISIFFILSSLTSLISSTYTNVFYIHIYVCLCACIYDLHVIMYVYIYLSSLVSTYERKHVTFVFQVWLT
jgi:hypothetical protein